MANQLYNDVLNKLQDYMLDEENINKVGGLSIFQ